MSRDENIYSDSFKLYQLTMLLQTNRIQTVLTRFTSTITPDFICLSAYMTNDIFPFTTVCEIEARRGWCELAPPPRSCRLGKFGVLVESESRFLHTDGQLRQSCQFEKSMSGAHIRAWCKAGADSFCLQSYTGCPKSFLTPLFHLFSLHIAFGHSEMDLVFC